MDGNSVNGRRAYSFVALGVPRRTMEKARIVICRRVVVNGNEHQDNRKVAHLCWIVGDSPGILAFENLEGLYLRFK